MDKQIVKFQKNIDRLRFTLCKQEYEFVKAFMSSGNVEEAKKHYMAFLECAPKFGMTPIYPTWEAFAAAYPDVLTAVNVSAANILTEMKKGRRASRRNRRTRRASRK